MVEFSDQESSEDIFRRVDEKLYAAIQQGGNDFFGAGARNRTEMELPPEDFESSASTSFTTPA